jgi:predicted HNH restriction endonuclease
MGEYINVKASDWADNEEITQLREPLAPKKFGVPIFEDYSRKNEYIYGIYEQRKFGLEHKETISLISRIVEFIATINDMLKFEKTKEDVEAYRAVENRKAVVTHLQRERNSRLAFLRKQRDNFVCQICAFDFVKAYGQLGQDFAEAHHIVPLNKNDQERVTTIKHLITVCANCHRMLHRMKGAVGDVGRLKRIVRKPLG